MPLLLLTFGFSLDPTGFFGGIVDVLSSIVGVIDAIAAFLWDTIISVANWLVGAIVTVAQFAWNLLQIAFHAFTHFLSWLKTIFADLYADYLKVKDWLDRVLAPVLRILRRLQQIYRQWVQPVVFRVINLIQRLRQILVIFRLLHFKWAEKLDNDLARLEQKIAHNFLAVLQQLNNVISVISLVLDPTLILNRTVFGASGLAAIGALKRIMGWGGGKALTASAQQRATDAKDLLRTGAQWVLAFDGATILWDPRIEAIDARIQAQREVLSGQGLIV